MEDGRRKKGKGRWRTIDGIKDEEIWEIKRLGKGMKRRKKQCCRSGVRRNPEFLKPLKLVTW